jgi:alpha-tubulin suppressor-like RCC1 family protein
MSRSASSFVSLAAVAALSLSGCGDDGANVEPESPVATVIVTPSTSTLAPGGTLQLQAVTKDAAGTTLTDREIAWSSSAVAVATVSDNGLVTGVATGNATITATSEGKTGSAVITVALPTTSFAAVSAGLIHTCALTIGGAAYCWGLSQTGELGDGTKTESPRLTPVAVEGGVSFAQISVDGNSCAVTAAGAAHCWGRNLEGVLGVGTNTGPETCTLGNGFPVPCSSTPVPITGGLSFASVSVGGAHSCGITAAGAAYCWGLSGGGQLGIGTRTGPETCPRSDIPDVIPCSTTPVPVIGGLSFASLSAGLSHTCGVTTDGVAYCWGSGGTIGDGTIDQLPKSSPVRVAGGLSFASVSAGTYHTCGVTTAGAAYCWGSNQLGGLGDGTEEFRQAPTLVAGGLSFALISAGEHYSCGVTTTGAAYCWGHGEIGQLGSGDINQQLTPVPVSGGLNFASVSAASVHTCGVTTVGRVYCWGGNDIGQLGDGTTTQRLTPVLVAGG